MILAKENSMGAANKQKNRKLILPIVSLILIAGLLAAVYFRVNPRWRAAELTVEQAGTERSIRCIEPGGMTLQTRIIPPEGYTRTPAENGSFAEYLREYPLFPDGIKLPVYNGKTMSSEHIAAIFDISLGDEGWQQCADSIIRLYSDYFYKNGRFDRISFQFSNGDVCDYERWRRGKRMFVLGDFSCEIPAALPDDSEQQYMNYLKEVMNYAGTLSLQKESEVISPDGLRIGDIICSDSHVVLIADEAVNEKGEKCYLIGQSFIPAVCFHIVTGVSGGELTPWFTQEQLEQEVFNVGGFGFTRNNIRRWKDGF